MFNNVHSYHRNGGVVMVGVLAAMAILLVLYLVQIQGIFAPALIGPPAGVEQRPWVLEDMLVEPGVSIRLPKSPKPTLESPMALAGAVVRNDAARGTVEIAVGTDGRLTARWQADYAHQQRTHALQAEMTGNIDRRQTYTADGVPDKSRLFFIARGPYRLTADDAQTGRTEEDGTVWLLGYIRPDGRADGTLTLTTDRQWSAVYAFTAASQQGD